MRMHPRVRLWRPASPCVFGADSDWAGKRILTRNGSICPSHARVHVINKVGARNRTRVTQIRDCNVMEGGPSWGGGRGGRHPLVSCLQSPSRFPSQVQPELQRNWMPQTVSWTGGTTAETSASRCVLHQIAHFEVICRNFSLETRYTPP